MTQAKELIAKMLGNGIPAIAEIGFSNFLFGTTWQPSSDIYGIGVMVLGSFYVMAGALVIGVPLGILCAVFLACFGSDRVSSIAKKWRPALGRHSVGCVRLFRFGCARSIH